MGIGIKRSETGGSSLGASKMIFDALTNFDPINKIDKGDGSIRMIGDKEPILSLDLSDDELISLSERRKSAFEKYYRPIKVKQDANKKYWLGKQYGSDKPDQGVDNMIFESTETALPLMTRQNPDPLATCDDDMIAKDIMDMIADIADTQSLKLKIRQATRLWIINYLGCVKAGWNFIEDDIEYTFVKVKNLILDPLGNFDGGEFTGKYIGEPKSETAESLASRFAEKAEEIKQAVGGQMGTSITYIEWWTDEYVYWTLGKMVLGKHKNPHWNYQENQTTTDEMGQETVQPAQMRKNHFKKAKKPYSFIWMFNLGEQPHDETCLIEQAIPLQDMVNKKDRQIDKNADDANSGWVFNESFSADTAKKALNAMRNGGAIITPSDTIGDAVTRFPAPSLPTYVIEDMYDKRDQIRNIMGIKGSSAAGITQERTVRGKIQIQQQDTDRLSPIIEQIEQTIDYLYNYSLQMIYVYYTPENLAKKIGAERAQAFFSFMTNPSSPEVVLSVKEGSMIPQDPMIKSAQAVDMATAGLLDPLTMYERMSFPNPMETTQRLVEWKMNPAALAGGQQAPQMPGMAPVPTDIPEPPPMQANGMQALPPINNVTPNL